jgi:GWxTD domain-containing protein
MNVAQYGVARPKPEVWRMFSPSATRMNAVWMLLLALAPLTGAGHDSSQAYRRWLEQEVAVLITDEERELFLSLESDKEMEIFKTIFWARRDPAPAEPPNEIEEAFEARLRFADRHFNVSGRRGATTDRGKILLLLGVPSEVRVLNTEEAIPSLDELEDELERAAQEETALEPGWASLAEPERNDVSLGQSWVYESNEALGIPGGLTVEFRARPGFGYLLAPTQEIEKILERVKRGYIVNPDIRYPRDAKGRLMDLETATRPLRRALVALRDNPSGSSEIPLQTEVAFFLSSGGTVYVPFVLKMEPAALGWVEGRAAVKIGGLIEDEEGNVVYEFEEEADLDRQSGAFEMPLWLEPGAYTAYWVIHDVGSHRWGTDIHSFRVPALSGNELKLSSILLFLGGEKTGASRGTPGKAFILGGYHFTPKLDRLYGRSDRLRGVFNAYGYATVRGEANLTSQYMFFREGNLTGRTKAEPFLSANEEAAITVFDIPLSSFEPGAYILTIKVIDHITNAIVTCDIEFIVQID